MVCLLSTFLFLEINWSKMQCFIFLKLVWSRTKRRLSLLSLPFWATLDSWSKLHQTRLTQKAPTVSSPQKQKGLVSVETKSYQSVLSFILPLLSNPAGFTADVSSMQENNGTSRKASQLSTPSPGQYQGEIIQTKGALGWQMKGTLWAPSRCRGLDKANIQMSNNESALFDDILLLHALSLTHMIPFLSPHIHCY